MTTKDVTYCHGQLLWFAQNSLPLWLKWQHKAEDLHGRVVVICSKFITFVVEMTTCQRQRADEIGLWFAQNSLPLWLKWQRTTTIIKCVSSCDLLKIHYLCGWNENKSTENHYYYIVVICSKFITFVVEMKTITLSLVCNRRLWFAQNSLPLWLKWKREAWLYNYQGRCDLLKIHYLCGWNENNVDSSHDKQRVVICSKFITFVVEMKTICKNLIHNCKLWFAQNSLPLWLKWKPLVRSLVQR